MAKADDILKKYGITQVRNAETDKKVRDAVKKKIYSSNSSSGSKSSSKSSSTRKTSAKADDILKKYGIEQVRNAETDESVRERVQKRIKELDEEFAPVRSKKKEDDRKWFQKGAFEDGYDFGDITKTILGSVTDVGENLGAGIMGMGEKAIDALAYLAPAANQAAQSQYGGLNYSFDINEYRKDQENAKKFIQKDLYDEEKVAKQIISAPVKNLTGIDAETDSVFAGKSDSLIQSGGQLLGTMGLQAVGVPWFVTSGVTSFGSEAENAFNQGADYEEAGLSGLVSAGAEMLTEKLFGGSGLGETGLINTDLLTRGISNKLVKTLADYGVDIASEGFEEVFSEVASNFGSALYREERLKDILLSEEAIEGYIDSFIGGGVLGGVMNASNAVKSAAKGTDYRSDFTQNEQKVVDKVYEDRLAEMEKNGKVSAKEKSKLYEQVSRDLEKGYISTETIEEVLGGESKSAYDSLLKESEEYKKLYETESGKLSERQKDRLAELKERNKANPYDAALKTAREQMSESVFGLVKGERLAESYNERARRGQVFEADLTQYDAKQQQTIQKAVDSGILNNTRRTHEFVDMVAKISADKGVLFDFTNNQKLKDSGFAVDGKFVNGFVTKDGVTVNIDSAKSMNSIVGHEITHVLEGTEFYDSLKQTMFDYAKVKGDYQGRYDYLSKLYASVEGADIEAELTADLVGDYLFTDSDFISKLSTENRNVFQKIYDEIKYLYKVATAGSKEARELEKVKKAFEDAYRESTKVKSDNDADTKYSLVTDEETLDFLDNQEQVKVFRAMQMIDGELYPPMAAKVKDDSGKKQLVEPTKQNAWYQADERPDLIKFEVKQGKKNRFLTAAEMQQNADVLYGNPSPNDVIVLKDGSTVKYGDLKYKYELDKANGSSVPAAYNPYFHTSMTALNDQFSSAYDRPNLVVVEGYIPKSELTSGYQAMYAKDSVGETTWHAGPVASQLKGEKARRVFLSRWFKTGRIVPDAEAAKLIAKTLEGESLSVPWNVVTPSLRKALEAEGVSIDYKDIKAGSKTVSFESTQNNAKYSLSDSEVDKNYFDAVGNSDWETAERLVEEAAKKAGYTKVVYHGTDARFTEFDTDEESTAREQHAWMADYPDGTIFLAEDYDVADGYGERVMNLLLDTSNMKVFEEPDMYAHQAMDDKYGYEVYNYPVIAVKGKDMTIYATLDNTAVKSADTVTYGDGGEIIPLSERFKRNNPDIRYSLSGDSWTQIQEMQMEVNRLNKSILEFEASEDYKAQMQKITEAVDSGNIAEGVAAYQKWLKESGLEALTDKRNSLRDELDKLRKRAEETRANEALEEERIAIEKSGLSEADYFRKQAVKEFGYTPYFYDAGYIVSNGKMLNFSGEKGKHFGSRGQDHRAIGIIYAETEGTDALNRFVNYGNIRIVPESPGFDVSATIEPTKEQYATIKKFIYEYADKGYFSVDISDKDGRVVGSLQYENRINPTRIIADIKHYYETGEVRQPSSLEGFRFSLSEDTEGRKLSPATAKRFSNSKVVDEDGSLKVVYHGTASGEFSIFDKAKGSVEGDFGSGFYFTDNDSDVSEHYEGGGPDFENKVARLAERIEADEEIDYDEAKEKARAELYKGGHKFEVYLNIENPAIVGKTILFDSDFGDRYNEEDFDDYDEYIAETEQAVADAIEEIIWEVEKNVDVYSTDGLADVIYEACYEGGIGLEELKDRLNQLYLEDNEGNFVGNEVARQIIESLGYDGIIDPTVSGKWNMDIEEGTTHYIVFKPNQIKAVTNQNPTDNPDIHLSLSDVSNKRRTFGTYNVYGKDIALEVAPVGDNVTDNTRNVTDNTRNVTVSEMESVTQADNATAQEPDTKFSVEEMFPDEMPVQGELENLQQRRLDLEDKIAEAITNEDADMLTQVSTEYDSVMTRLEELENDISETERGRAESLSDADAPPEMEAPIYSKPDSVSDPFTDRDWYEVGRNRSTRAFMRENPEFKPFFQEAAATLLYDLSDTQKAERWYNDQLHYESGGERGFGGQRRLASDDIAQLLDEWGLTYAQIEEGLTAIVEDNDKVNNAPAKRIEFKLNERLLRGYKDFHTGKMVEPNYGYIAMLRERQANAAAQEAFDTFMEDADMYAPEDIAPVPKKEKLAPATPDTDPAPIYESKEGLRGQTSLFAPPKPNPSVATVLTKEAKVKKEKSGIGSKLVSALVDKGMVFENLSLETGNHELQAKYNYALPSNTEARAQYLMENGESGVKSLKSIIKEVGKNTEGFFNYLYHVHNIDRMTLEDRFNVPNKTVFGETVTAGVSRIEAAKLERANPNYKVWAEDIYAYNKHLRNLLVKGNVISQETADLWEKMYPHYVPIRRADQEGQNISVPLDSRKTGVNNPVKRAIGGSGDILPLFETMAMRTEQTYRAIARNDFGIELKNTLGTTIETPQNTDVDEMIDTLENQEEKLLKPGTMFSEPTFTVFENGERVEFEITEDMYDALKPAGKLLGYRNKAIQKIGDARRNLLTVWNPVFALYRNPIKDIQEVAINSQHPVKTYANVPNAIFQMATKGKWANEYHKNGGKSNTYFDSRTNEFKAEDNIFKKVIGMPVRAVENAGEFIEEIPRLAEYIASRKEGRSVERSMLDSARVTTNFAAGGDFTKFLNSHGFTFLNASVQGASQHVRNIREAKANGLKGYVKVLAKYTAAGLPGILLNSLLWDDDEDYEELNDYVKQNYYVVAKTEDGKFIRLPKGRTAAVIQNAMEQMENLVTGNDEADFQTFFELFMNNIAPNNPIEDNILAPIGQTLSNNAWYGGEIVPSRLQSLPAEEQFDESTDSISKWLGEKTGTSPVKWNYLIDQYSGGLGDVFLPMLTPEAESGDNSLMGNFLAPWKKEITTDKVLNNKNPGDFYDLRDELEKLSNSRNATQADEMRTMYMDSVSWEMSDLYAQKREVQNSDLPDDKKYAKVRQIQEQINALAKNAMERYNHIEVDGLYSEVGDKRYNQDAETGKWYEIRKKNSDGSDNYYYQKEQEVTKGLGITYGEYWNNREEYNYAYDNPEKYTFSKAVGGYKAFRNYTSELWDIKADKDENGKPISGSRKEKVIDYVDNLDADYGEKIILFKSEYPADDTYNEDIIDYLNSRDDISYEEMVTILKYLEFEVDEDGTITWD